MDRPSLDTSDDNMLKLIKVLIDSEKIHYKKDFAETIGVHKQLLTQIQTGKQHFTAENIRIAAEKFNVNSNWIFGFEDNIFRKKQ